MASLIYPSRLAKHEIRLLTLPPSTNRSPTTPLGCSLETTTLSSRPSYIALSYVWGPAIFDKTIVVNGVEDHITSSLFEALCYMQEPDKNVTMWADAICINQGDAEEKGEQVQLMKDIYERALYVHVWLGLAADGSDELIDTIAALGTRSLKAGIMQTFGFSPEPFDNGLETNEQSIDSVKSFLAEVGPSFPFTSFNRLMKRTWWSRIWVVQELAVGREVVFACGERRVTFPPLLGFFILELRLRMSIGLGDAGRDIPWDILEGVHEALQYPNSLAGMLVGTRVVHQQGLIGLVGKTTLMTLLVKVNTMGEGFQLGAHDDRDRIFALLSMAADSSELGLWPNYSSDCSTVYIEAARQLLLRGHVSLLAFCKYPKFETDESLPSWVPDWRGRFAQDLGAFGEAGFYTTGLDRSFAASLSDHSRHIKLGGTRVCKIEEIGTPLDKDGERFAELLLDVRRFVEQSKIMQGKTLAERDEAIWRIPIKDLDFRYGVPDRAPHDLWTGYNDFVDGTDVPKVHENRKLPENTAAGSLSSLKDTDIKEEPEDERATFFDKTSIYAVAGLRASTNQCAFLTNTGFVGVGPANMCLGDEVYVVFGSAVPYVFRGMEDRTFQVVGSAYVHGIMDGEMLNQEYVAEELEVV